MRLGSIRIRLTPVRSTLIAVFPAAGESRLILKLRTERTSYSLGRTVRAIAIALSFARRDRPRHNSNQTISLKHVESEFSHAHGVIPEIQGPPRLNLRTR